MTIPEISIENKSILIFGVSALILSLLTGMIAGVDIGTVMVRSIIITLIFAGLGFGIVFILKKFVPEFYEILTKSKDVKSDDNEDIEKIKIDENKSEEKDISQLNIGDEISDKDLGIEEKEDFTELEDSNLEQLESVSDLSADSKMDPSSGKLGQHVVAKEQVAQYEPEIMAEAIRTMMGKDED